MAAKWSGSKEVVQLLEAAGAKEDNTGKNQQFIDAIADKDAERIKALLNEGADVNARDVYGATPLMWAANANIGDPLIVKLLIDAGADVNAGLECMRL